MVVVVPVATRLEMFRQSGFSRGVISLPRKACAGSPEGDGGIATRWRSYLLISSDVLHPFRALLLAKLGNLWDRSRRSALSEMDSRRWCVMYISNVASAIKHVPGIGLLRFAVPRFRSCRCRSAYRVIATDEFSCPPSLFTSSPLPCPQHHSRESPPISLAGVSNLIVGHFQDIEGVG